jgi:hypothetical protein
MRNRKLVLRGIFVTLSVSLLSMQRALFIGILLCAPSHPAFADSTDPPAAVPAPAAPLPDSPGALLADPVGFSSSNDAAASAAFDGQATKATTSPGATATASTGVEPLPRVKFVYSGKKAPSQTATDKVILGLRESITPFSMIGWVTSAGWAQLIDGSPNYGTNGKAFSQRLGAAAALGASKEIFSDSVMAPIFHQDPRYYQLGHGHKFINRAIYAGTRPIVGRTDSGKTIPNYAFILGTGGAAALTKTYYPQQNTTTGQLFQTWATSLGGSSLGYLVSEFGGEVIQMLHITKPK